MAAAAAGMRAAAVSGPRRQAAARRGRAAGGARPRRAAVRCANGGDAAYGSGEATSSMTRVNESLAARETELLALQEEIRAASNDLKEMREGLQEQVGAARRQLDARKAQIEAAEAHLESLTPVLVEWSGRAHHVEISGSFDGWTSMVPLERQSEFDSEGSAEFSVVMRLYPGSYEYKFVVDGNWLADPNQEMTAKSGNVNNILRVVAPVSGPAL